MAQDETSGIDLDERMTKSEALNAALLEDSDDDSGGDDDIDFGGSAKGLSAKEIRTTLARGEQADDEDEDEGGDVEPDVEEEEEKEEEPAGDELTDKLFEKAKEKGFDVDKYQDADAFLDGVVNLVSKLGEKDQLAVYGRQMLEDPLAVYKHLEDALVKSGKLPSKEATKEVAPKPRTDRPEFKEEWIDQVFNPDGTVKENADKTILRKVATWQEWSAKEQRRLLSNPAEYLKPELEGEVRRLASEIAAQELAKFKQEHRQEEQYTEAQYRELMEARELFAQDEHWVFVDPADKTKGLTPAGKAYKKWVDYAEQRMPGGGYRIPNVADRREFARAKAYEEMTAVQKKDTKKPREELKAKMAKKPMRASSKKSKSFFAGKSLEQALLEGLSKE